MLLNSLVLYFKVNFVALIRNIALVSHLFFGFISFVISYHSSFKLHQSWLKCLAYFMSLKVVDCTAREANVLKKAIPLAHTSWLSLSVSASSQEKQNCTRNCLFYCHPMVTVNCRAVSFPTGTIV